MNSKAAVGTASLEEMYGPDRALYPMPCEYQGVRKLPHFFIAATHKYTLKKKKNTLGPKLSA